MAGDVQNWAFILPDGTYKGGVVDANAPADTECPAGCQVVQVMRFPAPDEHWDFAQQKWSSDSDIRAANDAKQELIQADNPELVRLTEQRVQEWLLQILPQLVPGLTIDRQQVATLFPLARKQG